MTEEIAVELQDVAQVVERCREETQRFFRQMASDNRYCLEVFRRALTLHNQYAWDALYDVYHVQVRRWILRCSGVEMLDEGVEDLVNLSFGKFWSAMRGRGIAEEFHSLPTLLQYLRICCTSVVTDAHRRRGRQPHPTPIEPGEEDRLVSRHHVEREVARREESQEIWRKVAAAIKRKEEQLLLRYYFHDGLKPRQIHAKYPDVFPDIQDVYRIKRNVITRLRNQPELREMWENL